MGSFAWLESKLRGTTPRAPWRVAVGFLTLAACALTLAEAAEWQSPESIASAAREFVLERVDASHVSVEAVGIDERLRLAACTVPLTVQAQSELRGGNGTVAVSCAGAQRWRLYVPVRAAMRSSALVTRRALQAGERIDAADLVLETRSTATLPYEYLTSPEQAVGASVRRTIPAGAVLVPAALRVAIAVERGALVTLVATHGTVTVKTEGTALEPARLDERVRVRSASGRVVEGVVSAPNEVQVGS